VLPQPTGRNYRLQAEDVRAAVVETLQESLGLSVEGRKVDTAMVLDVLVYAAATGMSIHGACEELTGSADDNTIREYVNESITVENLGDLEEAVNAMLTKQVPRKVRKGRWDVACDLHDQPFYGKSPGLRALACRGEARDGTTHFYRIATLCLLVDGIRLTLAMHFVRPGETLSGILEGLIERALPHLGGLLCMYLDKGFASIDVYHLLEDLKISAIISCPIRGKNGGTRALCTGGKSYATKYTFSNSGVGTYTAQLALVRVFHDNKPYEKCIEWRVFVQINNRMTLEEIRTNYRRRFGIESSYRCLNQVRANTTSRNPALRFFFLALALILVNTWILLRYRYCQVPRRGRLGRLIDEGRFRLMQMGTFIRHAIERRYGFDDYLVARCRPQS